MESTTDENTVAGASPKELELRHRLQLSELLRQAMDDMCSVTVDEFPELIARHLGELGAALGALAIGRWEAQPDGSLTRRSRWTRPGMFSPAPDAAEVEADNPLARLSRTLTKPLWLGDEELQRLAPDLIQDNVIEQTRIVVPAMGSMARKCFLVVTREAVRPFAPWEVEACTSMTSMLPRLQKRLEIDAQLAASFYDAPLGVTLRDGVGRLIDCNQAFLNFLGVDAEADLLGDAGVSLLNKDELTAEMIDALAHPAPEGYAGLELPYRHASGATVWGRLAVSPLIIGEKQHWLTHIEDVTEFRAASQVTINRANFDALTGVYNRHALHDRLEREQHLPADEQCSLAMLLIDLDGFKAVNDTFGHSVGDALLVSAAKRLRWCVRRDDMIVRYGGDEFVIVIESSDREAVNARAAMVSDELDRPFDVDGHRVSISASVGVAWADDVEGMASLIERADAAMYDDKRADRDPEPSLR